MVPTDITQMSDVTLYEEYQSAKEEGPQPRLDDLQLEIARRWERSVEREYSVG